MPLAGAVATWLSSLLLSGMLTVVIGRAVFGTTITVGEAWRRLRPRIWALIGFTVLEVIAAIVLVTIVVLIIAILPGLAAAVFGYTAQMAYKAQSRYCAQMAFLFDRAFGMLPEPDRVGRKSIMAGALEPEVLAYVQAVFSDLGTSAMRESAGWVALHRDHVVG